MINIPEYKKLEQKVKRLERKIAFNKKTKDTLKIKEAWLQGIFESLDESVLVLTTDRILSKVNPATTRIFGYSETELIDQSSEILYIDHAHFVKTGQLINTAFNLNKSANFEIRSKRKTGEIFPSEHTVSQIKNNSGIPIGIVSIIRDITDRNQAEKQLKENQNKYQSLSKMLRRMCDNVPTMIWAKDLEKRFIFTNKAICRDLLNACDTSEPIGKTDLFFAARERSSHPENPDWHTFGELCQDSDTLTLEKGSPQQFYEFGNIKGQYLCLDVYKAPFVDGKGQIIGVVGSARDITDAKKSEEKLKKWNEDLEKKIKKRTASLEDFNTTLKVLLKKREEDKHRFGENIYANFNSLITPLLNQLRNSFTKIIQEDILDLLESSLQEIITPFSKKMSDPIVALTPTEIEIAMLVKQGKANKEISEILNKSLRAVFEHRQNIRQKLGLKNKKINLRTYLLSLKH